jgi:hypothetical protein
VSSGEHGAIKVERCIYRRENGRYAAKCWRGGRAGHTISQTFDTLAEAREFRDRIRKKSPKRHANGRKIDWSVSGVRRIASTGYIPDDISEHRKLIRKQIASAPRKTIERDGKRFTVVLLPAEVST